jgi:hypothetical protein
LNPDSVHLLANFQQLLSENGLTWYFIVKTLQKIGALLLIPVILFSSFGFTINVHYCKGEIKNVSFFVEAEACDMASMSNQIDANLPPCHQKKLNELKKKIEDSNNKDGHIESTCCHNQTFVFESNQEIEQNDVQLTALDVQLVMIAWLLCDYSFFTKNTSAPVYSDYDPPLIRQDFSVLFQSFLI